MDMILSFLAKPVDKHGITLKNITYPPLKVNRPRNSLQKFYGRYPDLVAKYRKSVRDMLNDSFPF